MSLAERRAWTILPDDLPEDAVIGAMFVRAQLSWS
jgi:hypothetical protein